jgi:hypothetical protein
MQNADALLTIAEISIAFAGFTSIAVLFRGRSSRWLQQDAFRFQAMLATSFSALLFSALPIVVHSYGTTESASWGISSAALLVAIVVGGFLSGRAVRRLAEQPDFSLLITLITWVGGFFAGMLLSLNILAVSFNREPGPYLTALLWLLALSSVQFIRLVRVRPDDIVDPVRPDDSDPPAA